MAIIKSIDTQYGIAAAYWKIDSIEEYYTQRRTVIILAAYIDHDARLANKDALPLAASLEMKGDAYVPDATRMQLYDYIKSLPEFTGSEDV